jgi:dihydrofolate reductase
MSAIRIIAAVADNGVIGNAGALPWRIPDDLARFKVLTMGHTLVMGRKTFESIGRPLPGRTTVVLTRRADFAPAGVLVARDRSDAIERAPGSEIFVAGGADVYALFLPLASTLFLTHVHGSFAGDTFFPFYTQAEWTLVSEAEGSRAGGAPPHTFRTFTRNGASS